MRQDRAIRFPTLDHRPGSGYLRPSGYCAGGDRAVAQEPSSWSERAPMLLPRSEASVAELNGKVYFMGGYPGAPDHVGLGAGLRLEDR